MDDAFEVLRSAHRRVEDLFEQIRDAGEPPDPTQRRDLCELVMGELDRHCTVEENLLYPLLHQVLPANDTAAETCLRDHTEVRQAMQVLVDADACTDADRFTRELAILVRLVRHHLAEEDTLLSRLERNCTPEQRDELAAGLHQAHLDRAESVGADPPATA